MADKKISELNSAATVYDADDFALVQDGDTKQVNASAVKAYIGDAPTIVGGTIDGAPIGSDTASTGAFTTLSSSSTTTLNGTTIPASKTLLVTTDIGSSIQAYDADLSAIAALSGTSGLLKKTAADTWTLDTSAYSTTVGTVTSVSGTGTVNGLTLTGTVTSSGSLTLGGTLDLSSPPAIGGTTPAAGAFTTLSSTGNTTLGDASTDTVTINGTAVSIPNNLNFDSNTLYIDAANNRVGIGTSSPIDKLHVAGGVTSTALSAPSNTSIGSVQLGYDGTNGVLRTWNSSPLRFDTAGVQRLLIDSSGNLGLGVAPSGWLSGIRAFQISTYGSLSQTPSGAVRLGCNFYTDSAGTDRYLNTDVASKYQSSGGHYWFTAPSGTAGSAISFAQDMTLTSKGLLVGYTSDSGLSGTGNALFSGNVGIGTSSPGEKLDVNGAIAIGGKKFLSKISGNSYWWNNTSATYWVDSTGNTVQMALDSSGNLGLGVTPSAWDGNQNVLQIASGAFYGYNNGTIMASNGYYNSGWKYINSGYATYYSQAAGAYFWYTAPSGTAGNAISFTQAMTLTAGNNLLLGGTSDPGGSICIYIANRSSVPGTPSGGGVIYVEAGALKYKGSSGTITTLGAA